AAQIGEGQHRNRWLIGQWQNRGRRSQLLWCDCQTNAVHAQRSRDVLKRLLAEISKLCPDLAAHLAKSVLGDADPAGLADAFQPCRDVDSIAEDVVALDKDIAGVNADAPFHAALAVNSHIPLGC